MRTRLDFVDAAAPCEGQTLLLVGRLAGLRTPAARACVPAPAAVWDAMLASAKPGDAGATVSTFCAVGEAIVKVVAAVLPEACSRHNSPGRPDAVTSLVSEQLASEGVTDVVLALDDPSHALAAVVAVARALPLFDRQSEARPERTALLRILGEGAPDEERLAVVASCVRLAAELVDTPPAELHTDAFVEIARAQAARLGVECEVLQGQALGQAGFGGLWSVGRCATHGPALVVLDYLPEHPGPDSRAVSLVGKGVVYDTGGLSLKGKDHMPGMKTDMGGAAAVLGAFGAAVRLGSPHRITAILCLAENAIGPDAVRPDDVIRLYSGKTVEVNNTDAEGRLVLGDGVAYATRHRAPWVVIDVATLTGAQLVSTGRRHAASICNDGELEALAVAAGRATGDLVHPLPYCPELFRREFKSKVADMKNSVKDRMNAQSSCAAQFVAEHLVNFDGRWLHLDIAGPSSEGERGTGYGVALLVDLLDRL